MDERGRRAGERSTTARDAAASIDAVAIAVDGGEKSARKRRRGDARGRDDGRAATRGNASVGRERVRRRGSRDAGRGRRRARGARWGEGEGEGEGEGARRKSHRGRGLAAAGDRKRRAERGGARALAKRRWEDDVRW